MQRPIKKAIFPVAGLGTRFLPATKATPKVMLPIVDRPLIQLAVDEARAAGIEHMIFVTGRNKGVIEDYFDKQFELEAILHQRGMKAELEILEQDLPSAGQTSFIHQQEALGLGHAIWCARHMVGDEPFAVILPDMVMKAEPGCLAQMIDTYNQVGGGNILAVEEAPPDQLHRYGVVAPMELAGNQFTIAAMVEKPAPGDAPSNLIISGRYILQPEIFEAIAATAPGMQGELQVTDAMNKLLSKQPFHGLKYEGLSFDCGDKLGYLGANIAYALDHPDFGQPLRQLMSQFVSPRSEQDKSPPPEDNLPLLTGHETHEAHEIRDRFEASKTANSLADIITLLRQPPPDETFNAA